MNVITGKVEVHRDEWQAASALQPAALLFLANRLRWSVAENIRDKVEAAREAASAKEEEKDENNSNFFVDPMDPKKYIQQQEEEDKRLEQINLYHEGMPPSGGS